MNKITVLGATGSIGSSTIDVIRRNKDKYTLYAATANKNVVAMAEIIREFNPTVVVMTDYDAYKDLKELVSFERRHTEVLFGAEAVCAVAASEDCDSVMSAIVGAAGLKPTLAARSEEHTSELQS